MKVLFVSAEAAPFAKTGGLADVSGSLPLWLASMGNDVRIVMPRYKTVRSPMEYMADFPVRMGYRTETCIIRKSELNGDAVGFQNGLPVYFIDNYHYFDRQGIYCHGDDAERFAFFCCSVVQMLPRINFKPDVIHLNDWHTGPVCMLLKEKYRPKDPFYKAMATVFTIHNLEYQGNFPANVTGLFNVPYEVFNPEKVEFYGLFSFMKAGLVYADVINTVSKTYAREIQTEEYGEGLDGLLKKRAQDLYGILNGINYGDFNPETDPAIFKNYSADSPEAKRENKHALQNELGIEVCDAPLLGIVSRLTGQKGLDLVLDIVEDLVKEGVQLAVLGSGDRHLEEALKAARENYPSMVGLYLGFNERLARRIYAGSDIFLMPSKFEPCGLGQIIGLKYGTIPVVRVTGGLADTVADYDSDPERGNGFCFKDYSVTEFKNALDRALRLYRREPAEWRKLVKAAMEMDFSWAKPAESYMELYRLAVKKAAGEG